MANCSITFVPRENSTVRHARISPEVKRTPGDVHVYTIKTGHSEQQNDLNIAYARHRHVLDCVEGTCKFGLLL